MIIASGVVQLLLSLDSVFQLAVRLSVITTNAIVFSAEYLRLHLVLQQK